MSAPQTSRSTDAARRVLLAEPPFRELDASRGWLQRGTWPAHWIGVPGAVPRPAVSAYRLRIQVAAPATVRFHVTGDERYELFLDGVLVARGPERGSPEAWFFDTREIDLTPGDHVFAALVPVLGSAAPRAQMSVRPGFLLAPDAPDWLPLLATGSAPWECRLLPGYSFSPPFPWPFYSIGHNTRIDGAVYPWAWQRGDEEGWAPAETLHVASDAVERTRVGGEQLLRPATVPSLLDQPHRTVRVRHLDDSAAERAPAVPVRASSHLAGEAAAWSAFLDAGAPLTIPPRTTRRLLVDLGNYLTAHPELAISGGRGAHLRLHWAESLFTTSELKSKGDRAAVEGKFFFGVGDSVISDGGVDRLVRWLHLRAGRYVELCVETAEEPLLLERLVLRESRYPLDPDLAFECNDPRLLSIVPLAIRTLQCSMQDAFIDGPFYEQMAWLGDGVQNCNVAYALSHDIALPRKLLSLFDASRRLTGQTQARFPARDALVLPPYSLYWVQIAHLHLMWRGDADFIRPLLPGFRSVLADFDRHTGPDNLPRALPGWNFVDWVPGWPMGTPPEAERGRSAIVVWHLVWTWRCLSELERALGEPELAAWADRRSREIAAAAAAAFWNESRGLYADDPAHGAFSEHANCLALLGERCPPAHRERISRALFDDPALTRATISFTHYLFEVCAQLGRADVLLRRMELWFSLPAQGFMTLPEGPEPSRSDCHAWSAHPIFHYMATILGVRPASPGFASVRITPCLGGLQRASGSVPHPAGEVRAAFEKHGARLLARITLPPGVRGVLVGPRAELPLSPGENVHELILS